MSTTNQTFTASTDILNSWKEIAGYLNRGVRTVQRWEADLGMPVRRPRGKGRSAVLAVRSEIDLWIRSCPLENTGDLATTKLPVGQGPQLTITQPLRLSTLELHRLRADMSRSREELSVALHELVARLVKMMGSSSARASNGLACVAASMPNELTAV
ncbi:MAG TPA: hypothetical protein VI636_10565 [Candidatus Angelobacter sp.]